MLGDSLWAIVVVLGFAILAGALLFAKVRNKRSAAEERRTEQATHDLYRDGATEEGRRTP